MEAISLDPPNGVTGGELVTSESEYDGDDDEDDDARSGNLSIKGDFLYSSEPQEEEEAEKIGEEGQGEGGIETVRLADGAIGGNPRTIGSDDDNENDDDDNDNDDNDVRYVGSNRFAVLFESSDEEKEEPEGEEEQEDDMGSIRLADRAMEEKLMTIGSDDSNDDNAKYAPQVSNNRFAVLFESSEEEEEEEEAERQEEEDEWGERWGEEWDKEEEEVEEEDSKEEMEARQMEMEDDEAQEMQENWRQIDEEWEALKEWVGEEEEEEQEGGEESVAN